MADTAKRSHIGGHSSASHVDGACAGMDSDKELGQACSDRNSYAHVATRKSGGDEEKGNKLTFRNEVAATDKRRQNNPEVRMEEGNSQVLIGGDSNLSRCKITIMEPVKGDKRVAVGAFPGRKMDAVLRGTKNELSKIVAERNLVVIAAGLNNVLNSEAAKVVERLAEGVDLRAIAQQVQIVVFTVLEVQGGNGEIAKDVVAVIREIRKLSQEKGFEVADINREVHRAGSGGGFTRDGVHFNGRLGAEIGWRLAGRAVAFLGGLSVGVGRSKVESVAMEADANKMATRRSRKKTTKKKFNTRIRYINMQYGRKRAKWLEIEQQLKDEEVGVYALCETHLRDLEDPPFIDGYVWEGSNRTTTERKGGGVGMLIHQGTNWQRIKSTCKEHVWVSGTIAGKRTWIGLVYLGTGDKCSRRAYTFALRYARSTPFPLANMAASLR
ncbi:uncharacterized protein LOC144098101 [Amblyomma americanum]